MTVSIDTFLHGQEQMFRTVVEHADDGIFLASADGVYLHVNESGHRMLGYEGTELVGRHIRDVIPASGLARLQDSLLGRADPAVHLADWQLLRKDRSLCEAEIRTQRLANGDMLALVRDRSERQRDENRYQEQLGFMQKITSQVPGMVCQYQLWPDGRSCFPYASEQIHQIYRVSPESVREDASAVQAILHPDDLDAMVQSIHESAATLKPWQLEYRIRFPDGTVRWLQGSATPEAQDDGSVLWYCFISDITARKEAQQARALLQAQLQQSQKVESIGRLAGGVAHDFNNLLTSMLGFGELALAELPHDSRAAGYLRHVIDTAHRGASLTQQLLAYARKKIISPECVDLNDITRRLLPMIERLIGEDIELSLSLSEPLGAVMIDVGSVEQVLVNLVVNARDAMPGGGTLRIETCDCFLDAAYAARYPDVVPGWHTMLAVTDNGKGMHPEVLERVFEPFFTTKPPGQGTGLGLATCYGILRQASGYIHAYSEQSMGASFKVFLPHTGAVVRSQGQPSSQDEPAAVSCTETILVVEDEPAILQIASASLRQLGYRVLAAANGSAALALVEQEPVDLLFTDLVMPKMGGRELATQLTQRSNQLKVLYTSGYTEDTIIERGVLQQGIEFMQKPYSLRELGRRVRRILDA